MMSAKGDASKALRGLETLHAGLVQAMALTLRSSVDAAVTSAKATTRFHDKTGETRHSIRGQAFGMRGFVQAGGAARLLEFGTHAHVIEAKRARMLRFTVNGTTFFRRMVHHPGTAERPFLREARQRAEVAAAYGAEVFIGHAIRKT